MRLTALVVFLTPLAALAQPPAFKLAPAVCVEAEQFTIERGWKVIENGRGNMMVDIVGFNHISGERLLGISADAKDAAAFAEVEIPEDGDYRLWVRYEYPPFAEARFKVQLKQGERQVVDAMMGAKDNPRYAFGDTTARPQYDPAWGPEGLVDEVVTAPGLKKGKIRINLIGIEQPQVAGRSAPRNIDFVYLTRDTADAWLAHYKKQNPLYPILDAYRDSLPPRWEVRFTNRGNQPAGITIHHHYNRHPWGVGETGPAALKPGEASPWVGLKNQDTTHYGLIQFASTIKQPFDIDIRPSPLVGEGTGVRGTGAAEYGFYFPHYPKWGEKIISQLEGVENARKVLASKPAVGKSPTKPLCYGGWLPVGRDDEVGRAYAKLYAEIGMRAVPSVNTSEVMRKNLAAAGVPRVRSEQAMTYRNPPTPANIAAAKKQFAGDNLKFLQWFDYGDEIGFGEWIGMMVQERMSGPSSGQKLTPELVISRLWNDWLVKNRATVKREEYWRASWGAFDATKLKPDSSAGAAKENPRLYVDSLIFYEETAMEFAASGMKLAKKELGDDVWCGANYSGHPFYCPTTTMYIKWFRRGAADMGRHSDYFWQVGQAGPMINGYFAEHFRAGFRHNPKAVIRQYNMPHAPGNSDASFLRSAFTHLAHGAKMLDFFGIGMNDGWTENYVDFRHPERYLAIRDVTHALGFVEDVIMDSKVKPSPVALLVSESTERWDFAGVATDQAGHAHFGPDFRKTRLHHHVERLGLWKALTFMGFPPDLVIEEDLTAEILKDYRVLVVVGDCLDPKVVPALEAWVKAGGVLFATSRAALYDQYRKQVPLFGVLLGLDLRGGTESNELFCRVLQELPYLKSRGDIAGGNWTMPVLVANERIKPSQGTEVLAKFAGDQSAAFTSRPLGQGRVFYTAVHPGISYLWSALQPPIVADRSPTSHMVPQKFDPGAKAMLDLVIKSAKIEPDVKCDQPLIDARLIETKTGYILPLANYTEPVGRPVKLEVRVAGEIKKVSSAYLGDVKFEQRGDRVAVPLPKLGYGDVLRIER